MHRLHLRIHGEVQGVGFRYFVMRRARALGVSGRVRNEPAGEVEVEAEGDLVALRELLAAARQGPPAARVARVDETWSEGPGRHQDFRIG